MIRAFLYVYPHPHDPGKFLYVGQERTEGKRDKLHRAGKTSFGRRFLRGFPGVELPQPIRREVLMLDTLVLNEEETIDMFRFHTWRGYPGGMNLLFPGSIDYQVMGKIGGPIGGRISGCIQGRKRVESGQIFTIATPEGSSKGGRKTLENKTGIHGRTPEQMTEDRRISGRIAVESGHLASLRTPEHQAKAGCISGRKASESGHLDRIRELPQTKKAARISGHIQGLKNVESGQLASLRTSEHQAIAGRIGGRKARENKTGIFAPGYDWSKGARIVSCLRWRIRRGKSCSCGRHLLEKAA